MTSATARYSELGIYSLNINWDNKLTSSKSPLQWYSVFLGNGKDFYGIMNFVFCHYLRGSITNYLNATDGQTLYSINYKKVPDYNRIFEKSGTYI